ncbi:cadmium resistance transporter [Chondromyces crocatus]|uniref:Cadmium transporter n=1 Tax=Chondromyces crocatus TaxID=52 RepID=A0A0K1EP00_CHOCO|nr:cadmium resistance transporter [Chondromyces crocatus]AKT42566.1 cadmium transporter [Chondromyces crocatus]
MEPLSSTLGIGAVVFATTNIDDLLILSAFFSNPAYRVRQIVVGQFLGMAALTVASGVCALFAFAVPDAWLGLLGLAPLGLGLRGLWGLWRGEGEDEGREDASEDRPGTWTAGFKALAVAGVTVANGGDNLGVYIPLFSSGAGRIPVYAGVFAVMTAAWCAVGFWLVNNPLIGERIRRYGRVTLPFVLIALGVWILSRSRELLPGFGGS